MSEIIKPPTQSVGVAGFKADLYASDVKKNRLAYFDSFAQVSNVCSRGCRSPIRLCW